MTPDGIGGRPPAYLVLTELGHHLLGLQHIQEGLAVIHLSAKEEGWPGMSSSPFE